MRIPPDEAQLFHRLYPSFIGFVAGQLGGVAGIRDANTFRAASNEARTEARDRMLDNIALIDDFVEENPDRLSERKLSHVSLWRHFVRGRFVVERDLRNYTVLLDDGRPAGAYAVLGLTTEIVEMLSVPMPALVEAVLLPWKGRVVCDGLIGSFNISMGGGIRRIYRETYREAKARGIIMSLDPDWQPPPEKPARKPKTPAIARLLKKCPKTVAEFQLKYGEPRMDMAHTAAREYSVWSVGGNPALDIDYVMLYANIIRHQVLYVYAKDGNISHVAVVDPTDWRKQDFRPHLGNRLLR